MVRVAIIGAGASGLPAIKECLDYNFVPVCFEKTTDIGGLWRYKPHQCAGEASVMESTVINTSKEMMAYSDFPPPSGFPNFMHNTQVVEYFRMYAEHFKLMPHIRFETDVIHVKRSADYDQTGRWNLRIKDRKSNTESIETFDAVMLCTGHHAYPHLPKFPSQERYQGKLIHSHQYKDHRGYEGKVAIVVGIGNSGGDIAVELSRVCKEVYLVTRRGSWVFSRVTKSGYPQDMRVSRFSGVFVRNFPRLVNSVARRQLNARFDHKQFGLMIKKTSIKEFTVAGVKFDDNTEISTVDAVILATGYSIGFPYLEAGIIPVDQNRVNLYKYMYPPDLPHPTLITIGLIQPVGARM